MENGSREGEIGGKKPCIHKNKVAHNYSYAPLLRLQRGKTPKDLTVGCYILNEC